MPPLSTSDNIRSLKSRSASVTAVSRCPAPAPLTVASASASISPSPFAPPAPITVPPFKSPSPSHLIDNAPEAAPAQPDNSIISACVDERAAIEYVIDRTSASRDRGKGEREDSPSREGGQSVTGDLDAEMLVVDPSPARAPSQQVCPSPSPSSILPACMHTLRDRVPHLPWIPPIAHRRQDPEFPRGTYQRHPCSFPPHPKVSRPTIPWDETKNMTHQMLYISALPRPLLPPHHHRRPRAFAAGRVIRTRRKTN